MPTISEIRSQYPQYSDMSDGELADALYRKFYSDMPRAEFNQRVGVSAATMASSPYQKDTSQPSPTSLGPEGVLSAAMQGTAPDPRYYRDRYLGPATIGEEGETYYKDAQGNPVPTDSSKHVVLDNRVYERSPDTNEGNAVGLARVLSQGLATSPVSRAPGLTLEAARELAPAARRGVGMRNVSGLGDLEREAAQAVKQAGPEALTGANEVARAAQRAGVELPRGIASDNMLTQQAAAGLRNIPIVGDPIVKNTEKAIEQMGTRVADIARAQGGASQEGAGSRAVESILDWIGPRSKATLDEAYNAVDAAIDPTARGTLDETARVAAEIAARRKNAMLPDSPAVKIVQQAITALKNDQLEQLTAQYGPKAAAQMAEQLGLKVEPGGLNYKGVKDLRSYLGNKTPDELVAQGLDAGEVKQLYGALSGDLGSIVEKAGGTTGRALWERANKLAAETIEQRKQLADIVGVKGDASPAQVFDRIKAAAGSKSRADTELLLKAKNVIGGDWDQVVSAVTANLGKNTQGIFQPGQYLRDWEKLSDAGKSALYGTGAHRQALDDIAKISERWPQLQKFQNPSGTARGTIAVGAVMHPMAALAALFEPTTAAGVAGAAYAARKLAQPVTVSEVLSNPASAASAAAWMRAYEATAMSQSPKAIARLNIATRNLLNTAEPDE